MKMHYSHQLSPDRIAQIVGAFIMVPLLVLVVAGIFMAKAEHMFRSEISGAIQSEQILWLGARCSRRRVGHSNRAG
jgi:phosphotransferase system  glucose/maltose/N-acetylglucosamine-specific IIC component